MTLIAYYYPLTKRVLSHLIPLIIALGLSLPISGFGFVADGTCNWEYEDELCPITKRLSLEDCLSIALLQSPLSEVADEEVIIAKTSIGKVRASYYPDVKGIVDYSRWKRRIYLPRVSIIPQDQIPPTVGPLSDFYAGLDARFVIYDSGSRRARLLGALSKYGAASFEAEKIRQEILLNVALAFYNFNASIDIYTNAQKNLERARSHLALAKDRVSTGDTQLSDSLKAQVEVANAKINVARSQRQYTSARAHLNITMGWPPEQPTEVQEEIAIKPLNCIDLGNAQSNALSLRPEMQQSMKQLDALREQIHETESNFGPKVTARGGYGMRDNRFPPKQNEWLLGVNLEMPIFTKHASVHYVGAAKGEWRKARAELDQLSLKIQEEVWVAYAKLKEAYEVLQESQSQISETKENKRLSEERYAVGLATINDLLDSNVLLANAEASYIEGMWSYQSAYIYFIWTQGISLYDPCD